MIKPKQTKNTCLAGTFSVWQISIRLYQQSSWFYNSFCKIFWVFQLKFTFFLVVHLFLSVHCLTLVFKQNMWIIFCFQFNNLWEMLIIIYCNYFNYLKDYLNYCNSSVCCVSKSLSSTYLSQLLWNLTNVLTKSNM